ncbi:unnamed protein product [Diamesa hyperborea]
MEALQTIENNKVPSNLETSLQIPIEVPDVITHQQPKLTCEQSKTSLQTKQQHIQHSYNDNDHSSEQQTSDSDCSLQKKRSNKLDVDPQTCTINNANINSKFTSLVMITQMDNIVKDQVSVTANDTTQVITANNTNNEQNSIVVQHRNWQPRITSENVNSLNVKSKIGFYEENISKVCNPNSSSSTSVIQVHKNANLSSILNDNNYDDVIKRNKFNNEEKSVVKSENNNKNNNDDVQVITGADTLSAVVLLEDGLADDDSWVDDQSQGDEEFATTTATESDLDSGEEFSLSNSANDREEELRGYNRASIDFTLHTIVEESCEESEVESVRARRKQNRVSASELEKYFFFGLGGLAQNAQINSNTGSSSNNNRDDDRDDTLSDSSSVCSEGIDSLNCAADEPKSADDELASSRLEKYFLTGFMGFTAERNESDGSGGSVGSDSEGRPSPEQRRKKLVRARGAGRSHSSSLDNLLAKDDTEQQNSVDPNESDKSSETDSNDETLMASEKTDSQYDTVKRKKKSKKVAIDHEDSNKKIPDVVENKVDSEVSDDEDRKTPQPEFLLPSNLVQSRKQHSRDSGFIGSNDDLLKTDGNKSPEMKMELEEIKEENRLESEKECEQISEKVPPSTNLTRKDSFNNWSSDEETNLMMSKMRQFFKTLVAASANAQNKVISTSQTSTPVVSAPTTPKATTPVPRSRVRSKPPQLVYFENELTRLMKTVPGIKDEQVREIVEYLSSEDTWSDSYDSSDYTSSDLEVIGKNRPKNRAEIQKQISDKCQQIFEKFDGVVGDEEGDLGDGGLIEDPKETAFVYQKLVASISKISDKPINQPITSSTPMIANVMHHIGSRLVALMHEVSSVESMKNHSPKPATRHHIRRLQAKISDEDTSERGRFASRDSKFQLPRSKSHDLLLNDGKSTETLIGDDKEASDNERCSWRGSFESTLPANGGSMQKLNSASAAKILAAKHRSAGDLLFSSSNISLEQLDRVRSCGSIGGAGDHDLEAQLWEQSHDSSRRRSGVLLQESDESSENEHNRARSTLPRSLQLPTTGTRNSLPRLPTTLTAQSTNQFLQSNVKSARYRAPGFDSPQPHSSTRALSAHGLQSLLAPRRDRRNKLKSVALGESFTYYFLMLFSLYSKNLSTKTSLQLSSRCHDKLLKVATKTMQKVNLLKLSFSCIFGFYFQC